MVRNRDYIKKHITSISTAVLLVCLAGSFVGTVAMFFNFTEVLLIKEFEP